MKFVVAAALAVVGAIHLLPLAGVLGASQVGALYGVDASDPDLAILLRHRAVLFGLLGSFFILAAFKPAWRTLAFIAGFASVLSFLVLAALTGGYNAAIARVVQADAVALGCLVIGVIAHLLPARAR